MEFTMAAGEEVKMEPVGRVCVVGSGASGLVVMKELKEVGIEVTCFELLPRIGGVYAKAYDNMLLTTSSLLTSYSSYSDGKESSPVFWTDVDYLRYLDAFASKYDLLKDIQFRTAVEEIRKDPVTGKWMVTVRGGREVPEHRTYGQGLPEDPTAEAVTHVFDAVAIAAGTNNWKAQPKFEGQDLFKGVIVHADDFRHPQDYTGKRVAIVGGGESASDICNEISKYAKATCMVIREKHGHLIPRKQTTGRVTDLNTNRVRYSNPYIFGDCIGWTNQQAKRLQAMFTKCDPVDAKVMKKIAEFNIGQSTSAFSKTGCKNTGFIEAIVLRGAEFHRCGFRLEADRMVFTDGNVFECDAIIACTGYCNKFPYLEKYHPDLACDFGTNPRKMYKQVFPPSYKGEVAFFGFARPAFGSLPPTSEMQARYYAMVMAGEKALPSLEEMEATAEKDKAEWERRFKYDAPRIKGLVDYQIYADDLAKLMGVMPPLGQLFWRDFKVWFKIMFGPFSMHQYRLVGPHATPDFSKAVIRRFPAGDVVESIITASFLVIAKTLSLLGLKQFTPNNF